MEEKILAKVDELSQEMIDTIIRMVQIDSVEAEPEPDAPFGRGVKRALVAALELAGIAPGARGETLSAADFARLADALGDILTETLQKH